MTSTAVASGLRPFFSYYGGKWRDAPKHFPAPEHARIVEPFAGSAGYAVRYPQAQVVLCDIDPIIASVWDYLIHVDAGEILSLPDVQADQSVDDLAVCAEARSLIGFWLNHGASAPRKRPSAWMRSGIRPASFWGQQVRERIASQVDSIRHWQIHNVSFDQCPVVGEATWFIDPPYELAGSHYRFGANDIDFTRLGLWCRSLMGQVIVCENEGARWLPFEPLADVKTTRSGRRSREVVYLGGSLCGCGHRYGRHDQRGHRLCNEADYDPRYGREIPCGCPGYEPEGIPNYPQGGE